MRTGQTASINHPPKRLRPAENSTLLQSRQVLSLQPRIEYYPSFLSDAECLHLVGLAGGGLGTPCSNEVPEYSATFLKPLTRLTDPVVREVEERIAQVTGIPPHFNEDPIKVSRYSPPGPASARAGCRLLNLHLDRNEQAPNRVVTVLMYLHAPESGGHTFFPCAVPAQCPPPSNCVPSVSSAQSTHPDLHLERPTSPEHDGDDACSQISSTIILGETQHTLESVTKNPSNSEVCTTTDSSSSMKKRTRSKSNKLESEGTQQLSSSSLFGQSMRSDPSPDPMLLRSGLAKLCVEGVELIPSCIDSPEDNGTAWSVEGAVLAACDLSCEEHLARLVVQPQQFRGSRFLCQ